MPTLRARRAAEDRRETRQKDKGDYLRSLQGETAGKESKGKGVGNVEEKR